MTRYDNENIYRLKLGSNPLKDLIYMDTKQEKASNPHVWQAGTRCLFLVNIWLKQLIKMDFY